MKAITEQTICSIIQLSNDETQKNFKVQFQTAVEKDGKKFSSSQFSNFALHAVEILNSKVKNKILDSIADVFEANIHTPPLEFESENIQTQSIGDNIDLRVTGNTITKPNFSVCQGYLVLPDSDNFEYQTDLPAVLHSISIPKTTIKVSMATHVLPSSHGSLFLQSFLTDGKTQRRVLTNRKAAHSIQTNMSHRDTRKLCQELHNRALEHKLNVYNNENRKNNLYSKINYNSTSGFLCINTPLPQSTNNKAHFISFCRSI